MQNVAITAGVFQLGLSFVLGLLITFGGFKMLDLLTRDLDELEELKKNNTAVGILMGSMLLSTGLICVEALDPASSTLQSTLFAGMGPAAVLKTLARTLAYFLLVLSLAVLCVSFSARIFFWLTRNLDEMAEIKNNNVAVAITLGAVLVVMGLFLSHGVSGLLQALVPSPALETIRIMGGS